MNYIKIYGLQRSGTNYLKAVLEKNYDVRVLQNIGGWKHGMVDENFKTKGASTDLSKEEIWKIEQQLREGNIPLLHCFNNPLAWITSMRNYLKSKKEKIPGITILMHMYNSHNKHWMERCNYSVRYEDLIDNQKSFDVIDRLEKKFKLTHKPSKHDLTIENEMARGGDFSFKKNITRKKIDLDYWVNEKYLDELTLDEKQQIINLVKFIW